MDLEDFDVNDALSVEGTWVPISKDARLRIARMNNEKYREFVKKKLKPYRSAMRAGTLDDELMTEIVVQGMARHILLDWEGMKEKGVLTPYSIDTAERWLRSKEPFRELVASLSTDQQLFQEADLEEASKN